MVPSTKNSQKGEIHNRKDVEANKSVPCYVFGTYEWVNPRKDACPKPDLDTPPKNCLAAVRLEDGTLVHLQPTWQPTAARAKTELMQYHKKAVVVTGFLLAMEPPPPNNSAYITGPCMTGPISISDREIWDLMHGGELKWE